MRKSYNQRKNHNQRKSYNQRKNHNQTMKYNNNRETYFTEDTGESMVVHIVRQYVEHIDCYDIYYNDQKVNYYIQVPSLEEMKLLEDEFGRNMTTKILREVSETYNEITRRTQKDNDFTKCVELGDGLTLHVEITDKHSVLVYLRRMYSPDKPELYHLLWGWYDEYDHLMLKLDLSCRLNHIEMGYVPFLMNYFESLTNKN